MHSKPIFKSRKKSEYSRISNSTRSSPWYNTMGELIFDRDKHGLVHLNLLQPANLSCQLFPSLMWVQLDLKTKKKYICRCPKQDFERGWLSSTITISWCSTYAVFFDLWNTFLRIPLLALEKFEKSTKPLGHSTSIHQ